ncbi:hypothetical protein KKG82_04650 [Patescibacteria group bacterium]|nr:hypothetical protein [Patescibacteria group bacterium]
MENDLIKVKEDAIKIQEADLLDTLKSIEAENTKSSFALIFASALIALLKDFDKLPLWVNIAFLVLAISSIIVALYNISAKKVSVHANVDEIFVKNIPVQWEEHLQNKHLFLRNCYQEARNLLYKKANLTRASFILVAISTILISIAKIIL